MAYTDINRYLTEIKREKDEKLLPQNIKRDVEVLGVTGTYDGIQDMSDATAIPDDVISPKVFFNKDGRQVGRITTQVEHLSSGVNVSETQQTNTYWIEDVSDEFGIAVGFSLGANTWYIYNWKDGKLGSQLFSMAVSSYPGSLYIRSVAIAKQLNSQGYVNIWCRSCGDNESYWAKNTAHRVGVVQYDYINKRIITSQSMSLLYSLADNYAYSRFIGTTAISPVDPNKAFVTYNWGSRINSHLIVYNNVMNTLTNASSYTLNEGYQNAYSSEWNDDGTYVISQVNCKIAPTRTFVFKINTNNTITMLYSDTTTKPSTIYKHYMIRGNKIYDFTTGALNLIKTYSFLKDYTSGQCEMWTYLGYLFIADYTELKFYGLHIEDDLSITPMFSRICPNMTKDNYSYSGSANTPVSNRHIYYTPDLSTKYKFEFHDAMDKIVEMEVQGEKFANIGKTTATDENVLMGKVFFDKDGETVGSMPNNGYLNVTPKGTSQSYTKGYYSSIYVEPVTNRADINIIPENIRDGVTILGVEGEFTGSTGGDATSDGNIQPKYLLTGYSAVVDGELIQGTMANYGYTDMYYTEEDQEIPTGYYDELYIMPISSSALSGYGECLTSITDI